MSKIGYKEIRRFVRVAKLRFEDARLLLEYERNNSAVYLGGYCVECMLKAVIISVTPDGDLPGVVGSFRGNKAHDYHWLRRRYYRLGGHRFTTHFATNFSMVDTWTTELRYDPRQTKGVEAERFLNAVEQIIIELEGRL